MIPDEVVDRVREEADIIQVIGEFVKLRKVGNSYRGPCPFHQGKHNNFAVSPRGGYVCFVCGEKGDVFTFVQKRLGLDFVESVKWVGAKAGVEVTEVQRRSEERDAREPLWEVNAAAASYFEQQLRDDRGSAAREYLQSRGISLTEAERFSIGYAPRDATVLRSYLQSLGFDDARQLAAGLLVTRDDQPEPRVRFRNRLMFPIHDVQGRVVGFGGRVMGEGEPKYLNSAESEVFSKGKLLYGLTWAKQSIRKAERLLVVEGYFDVIRVMLAGIEEVVAPLGTALTETQAALIRKYTKDVFLLYDSDAAGQKATFRAGDELLRNGVAVRVITLPEGEDPDTYVATHGAAGLERAIEGGIDIFERKIQLLERGGWFTDLRRKREAIDKLLPTIRATADLLTRDLYVSRTAEAAGVSREMLQRELDGPDRSSRRERAIEDDEPPPDDAPPIPARARSDRRRDHGGRGNRAERELVRILLHQRRFVEPVGERIGAESFTDAAYRRIFTELVSQGPDVTVEDLARTLNEDETGVLQELLAETGGLERADDSVIGSVNALLQRELDMQLKAIDRILSLASPDEMDDLLRQKDKLIDEMQSLGRPTRWKMFQRARN
jgi:DNA primase